MFPEGISLNVNTMERLEFELAYIEVAVGHFSHDTTGTHPIVFKTKIFTKELFVYKLYIYIYIYIFALFSPDKPESGINGEVTLQPSSTLSHPSLMCLFCMSFNFSIGSEDVLFSFGIIDIYQNP